MQRRLHPLLSNTPGTRREIESLSFGRCHKGRKAYLHAGLHADEPPGLLVLFHLVDLLLAAEGHGSIAGEIVVVPLANPIGMSQGLLHHQMGRFELHSSENFNRNYPDLTGFISDEIIDGLGPDATANAQQLRNTVARALANAKATTELDALRITLVSLAHDADIVLDIHCDDEAVMHLYTETPYWQHAEPLARYLGAKVTLLAEGSGSAAGGAFDEALSGLWWRIARTRAAQSKTVPVLPLACFAATVELRGAADVSHALARHDAQMLYAYLCSAGVIDEAAPPLPPLLGEPTPLSGSMPCLAPHGGVVAFHVDVGSHVDAGDAIADVIDPVSRQVSTVTAPVAGCFYARTAVRTARANQSLGRIAGGQALRAGPLLGA